MNLNLDHLKRSLSMLEAGLDQATAKGAFNLNEAYTLKMAHDNLSHLLKQLEQHLADQQKATQKKSEETAPEKSA